MSKVIFQGQYDQLKYRRLQWQRGYYFFLFYQLLHIALAIIFFALLQQTEPNGLLLFISGVINIVIYTRLILNELRFAKVSINPIWFYLGMSIMRLGVGTLYTALILWSGDYWVIQLGRVDAIMHLVEGHLLLLLGDYFFIAGFFWSRNLWGRQQQEAVHYIDMQLQIYKAGLVIVIFAFGIRVAQAFTTLSGFGQVVGYITDYGIPAGVFLMLSSCRKRHKALVHPEMLLSLVFLAANVVSGLSSYMKSDLLISLLPIVFLLFDVDSTPSDRYRGRRLSAKKIFGIAMLAYLFLFVVSGYSEIRRIGFWKNMPTSAVTISHEFAPDILPDLLKSLTGAIPGTDAFSEIHHYPASGAWHLIKRFSVTSWGATSIKLVDMKGFREDSFVSAVVLSVTPRILFPDKPKIIWGKELAVELGQARSIATATTATALTMQGFLYWWGGYAYVILFTLLSGLTFAFVYGLFINDWQINPVSALVIMMLAYDGFHWKEGDVLAGFPQYLYILIVFLPLSKLIKTVFFRVPKNPAAKLNDTERYAE